MSKSLAAPEILAPKSVASARFKSHRAAMIGLYALVIMSGLAVLAPWIAPYPMEAQDLAYGAQGPNWDHWMGTDYEGRDLLSRTLHGARVSFAVAIVATFVALVLGVFWGAVAGFMGGRVDALMMRVVDVLYGLPYMFFVIILMVWFGRSLLNVFIGLGAVSWLTMARVVRSQVMSLREQPFVTAAKLGGLNSRQIILRHILPNASGPILVYATLTVPRIMMEEAFLSFLGLGIQPPAASWGSLMAEGAALFREYPWLLIFPGLCLSGTLLALNFLGDGLRDAFDPRGGGENG